MHIGIREMYKIQDMSVKKGIKRVYFLSLCGNISSCAAGTWGWGTRSGAIWARNQKTHTRWAR